MQRVEMDEKPSGGALVAGKPFPLVEAYVEGAVAREWLEMFGPRWIQYSPDQRRLFFPRGRAGLRFGGCVSNRVGANDQPAAVSKINEELFEEPECRASGAEGWR